jgi:hypothetical protein
MPWAAIPYCERARFETLGSELEVEVLPWLIVLSPTGTVISREGRKHFLNNSDPLQYWNERIAEDNVSVYSSDEEEEEEEKQVTPGKEKNQALEVKAPVKSGLNTPRGETKPELTKEKPPNSPVVAAPANKDK